MATITETARHFYGHGQSWLFPRTAGGVIDGTVATALSLPEVDSVEISITTEKVERMTKRDPMSTKAFSVVKAIMGTGKITCSQHTMDLLALYLFGAKTTVAGGAVAAVNFVPAAGIVAGAIVPFPGDRTRLSTFTSIVDNVAATLVQGTNYEVDNQAGVVKFINVTGFTQPFKLNGTEDAGLQVAGFTSRVQELWLRHKVINIADNDDAGVLDAYRVQIDPTSAWNLLTDGGEPQKYELNFQILKDTTKSSTAAGGQFFRFVE